MKFKKSFSMTMVASLGMGSNYVVGAEPILIQREEDKQAYIVKASALNVRAYPSTVAEKVGLVKKNEILTVERELENNWLQIVFQGKRAYVCGDYVVKKGDTETISYEYTVNTEVLNVRNQPSMDGVRIGKYFEGEKVTGVRELENGWLEIDYLGRKAYVCGEYVTKQISPLPPLEEDWVPDEPADVPIHEKEFVVTATKLNVRIAPSIKSQVIDFVYKGEKVKVVKAMSGWYELEHKGTVGYVSSGYVKQLVKQLSK